MQLPADRLVNHPANTPSLTLKICALNKPFPSVFPIIVPRIGW
jgi:hypothetical protein